MRTGVWPGPLLHRGPHPIGLPLRAGEQEAEAEFNRIVQSTSKHTEKPLQRCPGTISPQQELSPTTPLWPVLIFVMGV